MPLDYRSASSYRIVAGAAAPSDDFGNTPATAAVVAVGATVNGKIETVGDRDMFKLQLTAGKLYSFAMQGLDDSGRIKNMSMTFSDAGGTVYDSVTVGPSNSYSFIPTASGSYYVGANASTDGTGVLGYTFKASEAVDDFGSSIATAGHIDIGGAPVRGTLDAGGGDRDWFAVSLVAGTSYLFALEGSASGWGTLSSGPTGLARLAIFDAAGNEVVQDSPEHSYLSNASVLPFVASATGTYYLGVSAVRDSSGAGGGTYALMSQVAPVDGGGGDMAHATPLPLDTTIHDRLTVATDKDVYKVSLTAGVNYVLDRVETDAPSGYVAMNTVLTDGDGHVVAPMSSTFAQAQYLVFNVAASGDYYLTTSLPYTFGTLLDNFSAYSLKLTAATSDDYTSSDQTTALLDPSHPLHGVLEQQYDKDWVRVHLEAGNKYAFELLSGSLNVGTGAYLSLKDEHGAKVVDGSTEIGSMKEERAVYTATSTGDYYLAVEGHNGAYYNGGDYTLVEHLLTGDAVAPVLQSASIVSGATGVPVGGGIEFTFDEAVLSTEAVLVNSRGETLTSQYGRLAQTFGNKMVIDPGLPLESGMTYTLTLGNVKDLAGNAYAGPKVYTFTTVPLSAGDYAADISTTGVLTAGTPVSTSFESSGDVDWFKFHAAGGKNYLAEGAANITIHDAAGNLLAPDALLNLPVAGDYYIGFAPRDIGPISTYSASVKEVADDYTANNTAPGQLAVGGQLGGAIDYHGDADRIKITLVGGAVYKITLTNNEPGNLNGLTLALRDAGGTTMAVDHFGPQNGAQTFLLAAPASGSYTLDVTDAYAYDHRGYTIAAAAVVDDYGSTIAAAAQQALDKVVSGTLQSPGDKDVFAFDLVAGISYKASLVAALAGVGAARWTLVDSKGNAVGPSSTQDQSFIAAASGKYYLTVSNPDTNTATYDNWSRGYAVKMAVLTDDFGASNATAGKLAIGATVAGRLETGGGDSDWFAVTLDAGATYAFTARGALQDMSGAGATDAPLRLLDASGKQLAVVNQASGSNNGNPPLYFTATAKGTYYVDVGMGHSGLAGDYQLQAATVAADDVGNDNAHATRLKDGIAVGGKLEMSTDQDVFKISLAEGALVTIDFGAPSSMVAKMTVTDSSGQQIGAATHLGESSGGVYVDSAQYQAGAAGDYYIKVVSTNAQIANLAYTVKATVVADDDFAGDASTTGVLVAGKGQKGMIGVAGDADWFKVHLEAGNAYGFTLPNSGGTLVTSSFGRPGGAGIDLYTADGAHVNTTLTTSATDVGVSLSSVVTGDYFVGVHGNGYQTGSYTLLATAKPVVTPGDDFGDARETAAVLALGTAVNGALASTADIDMFKLNLVAGTSYTFDGTLRDGSGPALQLNLMGSDGGTIYSADSDTAVSYSYTPTASGVYYIGVTDSLLRPGAAYTLKASATADDYGATVGTTGKLAPEGSASGKLDAGGGDRDWFAIALDKGGEYVFTLDGATGHEGKNTDEQGGATLRLVDASGKVLAETLAGGGTASLAYAADTKGTYYVEVAGGDGHATGAYALKAINDADDYAASTATKGVLGFDTPAKGMVNNPTDQDWFKVHLDGGKTYIFDMKGIHGHGGTLDTGSAGTGLSVFEPTGKTQVATSDGPSAATGETQLLYKAQSTGDYFVSAFGTDRGTYTLAESLGGADTTAPLLTASSLANGATGVPLSDKFVLTFDDAIAVGTGLRLTDSHGAVLSSARFTANGNTLEIDPHQNLAPGTTYTLSLPQGSVLDLSGNRFAGHASYSFTTVAPAATGSGGNGNDFFSGSGNGQKIDGGAGIDMAFYDDTKVPLEIYVNKGQVTIYQTGAGSADTLTGVERLLFPTHALALDIDGNGGEAYRLYQAAFNRAPDLGGVGFWINALDKGISLKAVAQGFLASDEFKTQYGDGVNDHDFVTHLYNNVLHRTPDAGGFQFWMDALHKPGVDRADLLYNFSESAENQTALLPVIGNGFAYTPYFG